MTIKATKKKTLIFLLATLFLFISLLVKWTFYPILIYYGPSSNLYCYSLHNAISSKLFCIDTIDIIHEDINNNNKIDVIYKNATVSSCGICAKIIIKDVDLNGVYDLKITLLSSKLFIEAIMTNGIAAKFITDRGNNELSNLDERLIQLRGYGIFISKEMRRSKYLDEPQSRCIYFPYWKGLGVDPFN